MKIGQEKKKGICHTRINSINEGHKETERTQINGRYKDPMDYDPTFFPQYLSSTRRLAGLYLVHRSLTVAPGLSPQYSIKTSRKVGGVRPVIESMKDINMPRF